MLLTLIPWLNFNSPKNTTNYENKAPTVGAIFELEKSTNKAYDIIIQKPLFEVDRKLRKNTIVTSKKKKLEWDFSQFKIKGIVDNGNRKMILLQKNTGLIEVYEGDSINGWLLKKIDAESVILSDGKTQINLLDRQQSKKNKLNRNTRWLSKYGTPK
jgi:hypothetical protein